jgi:hypothetical protein
MNPAKKKAISDFRIRLAEKRKRLGHRNRKLVKAREGLYDEVYFRGVEWLDGQ